MGLASSRLEAGLQERGVPYVSLINDYMNSDEVLYYGTDTHWNAKGEKIALEKTLKILNSL